MQITSNFFTCLVFDVVLTLGLPIPSDSNTASFGLFSLAYRRRALSSLNGPSSVAGHSSCRPQGWEGATPNTTISPFPALWTGKKWWIMGSVALALTVLYGLLAFVMVGIMSVDLPRLMVWNRTGDEQRRTLAGKVLKVRNRPDWLLVSLVAVSVAILEVLPIIWSHLFMASTKISYLTGNVVILVGQVGPAIFMPIFHLEISGRFTWFVRLVMWLSAPVTVLPAFALRLLQQRRNRGQPVHMDGLLTLNELLEFIRLHEKGQGYGGTLDDRVGQVIRDLLEGQIGEMSSTQVETEGSWAPQSNESIELTRVQSLHQEGSAALGIESTRSPTSIRSHCQEGSTAIEEVRAPGLRKRGERSTEGYESVASVVSIQIPEQAILKDPAHGLTTPVSDKYVETSASKGRPLRRDFPLKNLSSSVTPRRHRLPMMESYKNDRKSNGLVTDSFLLEHGWQIGERMQKLHPDD